MSPEFLLLDSAFRWPVFISINLVLIVSVLGAWLLQRPGLILSAVAWCTVPACMLLMESFPRPLLGLQIPTPGALLQLCASLHVAAQCGFLLAYFSGSTKVAPLRTLTRSNMGVALITAFAAVFIDAPVGYALYTACSLAVLLALVLTAAGAGRGAWLLLAERTLAVIAAFGVAIYLGDSEALPAEWIRLVILMAVTLGPVLSAVAIVVCLAEYVASTRATGISLRRRLNTQQAEIRLATKEAFLANESKYRFLASVSHDLRQPMYAINLYISTLFKQVEQLRALPEAQRDWQLVNDGLSDLEGSARHLNVMFEALLDLSRLASGSVNAKVAQVHIDGLLNRLEADYSQQAAEQGLRFRMRVPASLPRVVVQTDPVFLERVLRNLLVNALRYTESGGVGLSLVLRGETLEFRVVDTGPGIERSLHQRVFEEFFQVPSSRLASAHVTAKAANKDGTHATESRIGLGLAISARLAESIGTRIRISSRVGRGSVFYFRQPMRLVMRPQARPRSEQITIAPETPAVNRGLYTVVIDDEPEIIKSTRRLLETYMEAEVFAAENGNDAVSILGREGRVPDLIISDFGLPGMDGIQTIEALRDEFLADIPAILITGDTTERSAARFQESGLQVLTKPVTGPVLIDAVERLMQDVRLAQS